MQKKENAKAVKEVEKRKRLEEKAVKQRARWEDLAGKAVKKEGKKQKQLAQVSSKNIVKQRSKESPDGKGLPLRIVYNGINSVGHPMAAGCQVLGGGNRENMRPETVTI